MFEKESEEWLERYKFRVFDEGKCNDPNLYAWSALAIKECYIAGAEFGYNKGKKEIKLLKETHRQSLKILTDQIEELHKANEWHYVSKKDYPKDFKDIWICFITEEDMKDYVRGWYEYDIDLDEHYFKTSNDFGIATIKNVYAWMPLVPPKESE